MSEDSEKIDEGDKKKTVYFGTSRSAATIPATCAICGKQFPSKSDLSIHYESDHFQK